MLATGHVKLLECPVVWRVAEPSPLEETREPQQRQEDDGDTPPFSHMTYDALHEHFVWLCRDSLRVSEAPKATMLAGNSARPWLEYRFKLPNASTLLGVKFSPDKRFLAVQPSATEVQVLETRTGRVLCATGCKTRRAQLRAVHWVMPSPNYATSRDPRLRLYLVTSLGIELYALNGSSPSPMSKGDKFSLKHLKTSKTVKVKHYWHQDASRVVLLLAEDNVFHAFTMAVPDGEPGAMPRQRSSMIVTAPAPAISPSSRSSASSSSSLSRLCKFQLDVAERMGSRYNQLNLVQLYGKVALVFVDEYSGKLCVFALGNNSVTQTNVYDLFAAQAPYQVSEIDDVLVVHNLAIKVALLFDVRSDPNAALTAPLPIPAPPVLDSDGDEDDKDADGAAPTRQERTGTVDGVQCHYYDHWKFLNPCYLVDSLDHQSGVIWQLELDLAQIAVTWPGAKSNMLLQFLLKRRPEQSKQLILNFLRDQLLTYPSLVTVSKLFNMLNRVCYDHKLDLEQQLGSAGLEAVEAAEMQARRKARSRNLSMPSALSSPPPIHVTREERAALRQQAADADADPSANADPSASPSPVPSVHRSDGDVETEAAAAAAEPAYEEQYAMSSTGYVVINQLDMHEHVFQPLLASGMEPAALTPIVTEYVRSVYRFYLPLHPLVNELLINLLLDQQLYYEFHQHLQYHVLNDSVDVALRLLDTEAEEYAPAFQLAIDMLLRLKQFRLLMSALLKRSAVMTALRLLSPKSSIFDEDGLRPADFLEVALATRSTDIFFATFQFFERRNLERYKTPQFQPEDGCDKYVAHYRHLFESDEDAT